MRSSTCCTLALLLASCATAAPPPSATTPAPVPERRGEDAHAAQVLDEELARTLAEPGVRSALGVVLDPRDGRVLAMQSVEGEHRDPELPARDVRGHGSVAKVFSIAAALDQGAVRPEDAFPGAELTYEGLRISDVELHETMTLSDVIAYSSNVGTTQVFIRLGRDGLADALARFHLAHRVPDAARTGDAEAARVAYGPGLEATPLEIAVAYAAVVNGGVLHAPWREGERPTTPERVLSPEAAATMTSMLEGAVARDDGTGRLARVPGYRVTGKTGTARLGDTAIHGAFVGSVPAEAPRFVVLVDVVAERLDYGGGTIAAPAFARIAARLLGE